jgi:hypothetical protein
LIGFQKNDNHRYRFQLSPAVEDKLDLLMYMRRRKHKEISSAIEDCINHEHDRIPVQKREEIREEMRKERGI